MNSPFFSRQMEVIDAPVFHCYKRDGMWDVECCGVIETFNSRDDAFKAMRQWSLLSKSCK